MSKFFQRRDLDKTFFKVLVSMLMVFVLLICVASPSHAVVGVTSILIPSVIAALESWGISTAADGLDGDEIAEWFHDKLTSWETAAQISLANIVTGIKMTPIGQVLLNPIALAGIREFAVWLVQQEGLVPGSSTNVMGGSAGFFVPAGGTVNLGVRSSDGESIVFTPVTGDCFVYFRAYTNVTPTQYVLCLAYDKSITGSFRYTYYVYRSNGTLSGQSTFSVSRYFDSDQYIFSSNTAISMLYPDSSIPVYPNDNSAILSAFGSPSGGSLDLDRSNDSEIPTSSDIQDKEMLINTSLDVGADAAAWYEQVMNKVAANDMTATGTLVGAGTITADQVIDQGAITEQEGVVSWPDVTVPIGVSGLDEIFPFCIPFDIYHFFEALAADPVAPSFEIPFRIEGIVDYTFEIDFEPFDQVAQVLRLVELLAFCVGLAFVTRSMFIRG